jgi:hypothetical protein
MLDANRLDGGGRMGKNIAGVGGIGGCGKGLVVRQLGIENSAREGLF